ncbi:hypothetical protein GQ53DRAFT_869787, partial [Thozetella sp. PMI_491]
PPECSLCRKLGTRGVTRKSNRKGNAGRPYYKYYPCDNFLGFVDSRGNDPNNPPCHCGFSSKRQVAGPEKKIARGIHFVCRMGTCDFYAPLKNSEGEHVAIEADLVPLLSALSII